MSKPCLLVLLGALCALGGCATAGGARPDRAALRQQVGQLSDAQAAAFARTDFDGFVAVFAPDAFWFGANLDLVAFVDGREVTLPYRAPLVYSREGEAWRVVQTHLNLGSPP